MPTLSLSHDRHTIPYCQLDRPAALAWAANLAALELHVLLSRGGEVERPTLLVFDLDPARPRDCARPAAWDCG